VLYAFWNNHVVAYTEYCDVSDQLGGIPFVVCLYFEVWVVFLYLCYFSDCEWIHGVFFILIGKHKVHGILDVASGFTLLLC
jgi:hypothetical protein